MHTFEGTVNGCRVREGKVTVALSVPRMYGTKQGVQFVDVIIPNLEDEPFDEGELVSVTYEGLPEARGYLSTKVNPKTGQPYVNAIITIYDPAQIIPAGSGVPVVTKSTPVAQPEEIPF